MKNPTDFGKRVETGVDPCLPNCPLGESPTTRRFGSVYLGEVVLRV